MKIPLLLLLAYIQVISYGQYCTSVGPSQAADSNVQYAQINGESGTSITYSGCPGVIGLEDLTASESVSLNVSSSYTLFVQFGTCGGNYSGSGEAWIDFDQSGTFDPGESLGTWTGLPPTSMSVFNFSVPSWAMAGTTRMRIMQHEAGTLPLNPCATFAWGSVVDFTVEIGGGLDCSGYIGDDMSDPRPVASLPFQEDYSNAVCYTNNVPVYSSPDVFYRLIPANYGVDYLNISLCGSSFDTYLSVMNTDTIVVAYNDDYAACSPQSELTIPATLGDTLYVVVQGWGAYKGDYSISINDAGISGLNTNVIDFEIYPNPANDFIYINPLPNGTLVQILDATGRIVHSEYSAINEPLNLSSLSSGIYFIKIKNSPLQKIIIN